MARHSQLTMIHRIYTVAYADDTARAAATGFPIGSNPAITTAFVSDDIGRSALVTATGCLWMLTAITPTWVKIFDPAWASSAGYTTVQDEGGALTARTTINFTGAGVTAADNGGSARTDVTIPGISLLNNGAAVTYRSVWNITNAASITDNAGAGRTDITLPSGGGGGGANTADPFITYSGSGDLSAERVLTPYGAGMAALDLSAAGEARVLLTTLMQGLAGMGAGTGLVEQTGAASFAKRSIGVASANHIPTVSNADGRYLKIASNGADINDVAVFRSNLGLGTASILNAGVGTGDVPTNALGDARWAPLGVAFVTVGASASLPNERRLEGEAGVVGIADGGAGNAVTVSLVNGGLATAKFANNCVTNAIAADMPANTIKGNNTGGSADPKDLTRSEVAALMVDWQGQKFYNYLSEIVAETGAFSVGPSHRGRVVTFNNSSDQNVTIPAGNGAGFSCVIYQIGAGKANFIASGGLNIRNADLDSMTAGQWAAVNLFYLDNTTCVLSGRTM